MRDESDDTFAKLCKTRKMNFDHVKTADTPQARTGQFYESFFIIVQKFGTFKNHKRAAGDQRLLEIEG